VGSILACAGIIYVSVVAKRILKEELRKAEEEEEMAPDGENVSVHTDLQAKE
jgi:hypothetical protein